MRVLLLNQVFWPDHAATAQHADDLARHLVAHGHEVHAIASRSIYGSKGAALPAYELRDGVHVHRVAKSLFGKAGIAARAIDFGLFYVAATAKAFAIAKPDVVVCFTTPPFISLAGWLIRALRGSRFVYWVMDMYPDLPVACGVMNERGLATRMFETLNRFCLRRADRTVVLGRCMRERVTDKLGAENASHVEHIGVWSDQDEVRPVPREENPYRDEWNLGDRFVVMYSGNFGIGHDVETMCQAALRLRDDDTIRFAFVGGGKRKAEVEAFVKEHDLQNCVLAPYQPREKLDLSLSCPDAHFASMRAGVEGMMVPCKLFGIMAAGRPTLFVGHPSSELARVIDEHGCGATVSNGDVDGLVNLIRAWSDDPQIARDMGDRARLALSEAYNRERACEAWRMLLEGVVAERSGAAEPQGSTS